MRVSVRNLGALLGGFGEEGTLIAAGDVMWMSLGEQLCAEGDRSGHARWAHCLPPTSEHLSETPVTSWDSRGWSAPGLPRAEERSALNVSYSDGMTPSHPYGWFGVLRGVGGLAGRRWSLFLLDDGWERGRVCPGGQRQLIVSPVIELMWNPFSSSYSSNAAYLVEACASRIAITRACSPLATATASS